MTQISCVTINLQHIHPEVSNDDLLINTSCPPPCIPDVRSRLALWDISPVALASQFASSAQSGKPATATSTILMAMSELVWPAKQHPRNVILPPGYSATDNIGNLKHK